MATASPTPAERARNYNALVLQQVARKQAGIAAAIGVSESTVSRAVNERLEQFCLILAHAGLKVVPVELRCFDQATVDALLVLAKQRLQHANSAESLIWEDEGDE